jgi:hypothetical protein
VLGIVLEVDRYLLVNLACAVNSTAHFIGNTNLITTLLACVALISSHKRQEFLCEIVGYLVDESELLTNSMSFNEYQQKFEDEVIRRESDLVTESNRLKNIESDHWRTSLNYLRRI